MASSERQDDVLVALAYPCNSGDGIHRRLLGMRDCVERGCRTEGILPGGMKVKRRAAPFYRRLVAESPGSLVPLGTMGQVNLFALAVNEGNAAGGRVVMAPTNGAAGMMKLWCAFCCRRVLLAYSTK